MFEGGSKLEHWWNYVGRVKAKHIKHTNTQTHTYIYVYQLNFNSGKDYRNSRRNRFLLPAALITRFMPLIFPFSPHVSFLLQKYKLMHIFILEDYGPSRYVEMLLGYLRTFRRNFVLPNLCYGGSKLVQMSLTTTQLKGRHVVANNKQCVISQRHIIVLYTTQFQLQVLPLYTACLPGALSLRGSGRTRS
jgi:hypothetical protein